MQKLDMLDDLGEVLDVVEISNEDVESMSAEELKQIIFNEISDRIDKVYSSINEKN